MKKVLLLGIVLLTGLPFFLKAQTLYFGGTGSWTGSVWGTSISGPYTIAWISGRAAEFNIPNSTITGATTNVSGITANENVTVTSGGTLGTGGTVATIFVASGKSFNFGSQTLSGAVGTGFIKNGTGELGIGTGGSYSTGFTLNSGTITIGGVNSLGTGGSLTINSGVVAASITKDLSGKLSAININGNFTFGATTGLALSTANLTFDAPVSLGGSNRAITLNGTGVNTLSGIISGAGSIETGTGSTGTLTLSGANTYTGATTLSGGTLTLAGAGVIPDASDGFIFNGGTLKTGAFSENYPKLYLDETSNIILNAAAQSHNFAASNSVGWTSGKTITITGWIGGYNSTSGSNGKIFVGADASGLTVGQLKQIKFFNGTINYDATILSTGEVVPSTITVLPISLTSFTAKAVDKSVLLNWATVSEKNNQKFEVLKSADGKNFKSIATVDGAGNSDSEKSYAFTDENPYAGANYYQLKQVDFDGKTAYSTIVSANSKIEDIKLSAYVSASAVTVSVNSPNQTDGEISLFDMNGKKLDSKSLVLNKGYNEIVFSKALTPGTYFVNLISAGKSTSFKFIK